MAGRAPKLRAGQRGFPSRAAARRAPAGAGARNGGGEGTTPRFAVVAARFNERITQRLVDGALQAFRSARLGRDAVDVYWIPGSFELPQAAAHLARTGRYAGVVCLGVVIRGQTPHYEHVAREAAAGIRQVAITTGVPTTFGVITALNEAQAWDRAGGEVGNRGEEAAEAALEMAHFVLRLGEARPASLPVVSRRKPASRA
jgi:6,7-dimethyl-8-ribityllumazine synthase